MLEVARDCTMMNKKGGNLHLVVIFLSADPYISHVSHEYPKTPPPQNAPDCEIRFDPYQKNKGELNCLSIVSLSVALKISVVAPLVLTPMYSGVASDHHRLEDPREGKSEFSHVRLSTGGPAEIQKGQVNEIRLFFDCFFFNGHFCHKLPTFPEYI
jgi:hypothetical protein